ncbi:hypothetical protein [Neodiprion abietis nucleopolyhedrovirus]|uniref:F-box domain-containing protein n=1 Tax=Neodiprion abietis nucleopolyhedrovirus TaxID=204507 RepID=Q0ZP66_9CBAC|nr:hypothetical protein [Neodiprion abietis nucleopolyhedrovirus]ABC74888.1 unknown [Neodiprion abietis nucleopolyhedrovirus]
MFSIDNLEDIPEFFSVNTPQLVLNEICKYLNLEDVKKMRTMNRYCKDHIFPILDCEKDAIIQPRDIFDCWQYQHMKKFRIKIDLLEELQRLKVKFLKQITHLELFDGENMDEEVDLSDFYINCPNLQFFKGYILYRERYVPGADDVETADPLKPFVNCPRLTKMCLYVDVTSDYCVIGINLLPWTSLVHFEFYLMKGACYSVFCSNDTLKHLVVVSTSDSVMEKIFFDNRSCESLYTLHHYTVEPLAVKQHMSLHSPNVNRVKYIGQNLLLANIDGYMTDASYETTDDEDVLNDNNITDVEDLETNVDLGTNQTIVTYNMLRAKKKTRFFYNYVDKKSKTIFRSRGRIFKRRDVNYKSHETFVYTDIQNVNLSKMFLRRKRISYSSFKKYRWLDNVPVLRLLPIHR